MEPELDEVDAVEGFDAGDWLDDDVPLVVEDGDVLPCEFDDPDGEDEDPEGEEDPDMDGEPVEPEPPVEGWGWMIVSTGEPRGERDMTHRK